MSKKSEAIEYFMVNPDASPAEVARMFGVGYGNIYNYRKEALGIPIKKYKKSKAKTGKVGRAKKVVAQEAEPLGLKADDEPENWRAYSQFMTREEFTGFLRGGVLDCVANYDGSEGALTLARSYLNKLIEMQSQD